MISFLTNLWLSFLAGLLAPLLAVCILPLYPGFLSYLASQLSQEKRLSRKETQKRIIFLGILTTSGVIISMMLFGLIFTTLLQSSLTKAIGIISPIAFSILAIISILLIFDVNLGKLLPRLKTPTTNRPLLKAFLYGCFFGAIVLPCNPSSLVVLFALSTSTISYLGNFLNFLLFGVGMGTPLLILSILSATKTSSIINFLASRRRIINILSGLIMLGISLYYLIFVFKTFS